MSLSDLSKRVGRIEEAAVKQWVQSLSDDELVRFIRLSEGDRIDPYLDEAIMRMTPEERETALRELEAEFGESEAVQ